MLYTKEQLEQLLNHNLTNQKFQEISELHFEPLTSRVRTDLTGRTFQRLFVLGRAPSDITSGGQKVSKWWCICSCSEHTIISVRGNNLTSGNSKSCGCWNKEVSTKRIVAAGKSCAANLEHQRFGKLEALRPTNERRYGSVVWECRCDCGQIHYVTANTLQKGASNSCGCLKESIGSLTIKQLLTEANIPFETEKTFEDCKFPDTNRSARFDFWVNNCFLIEYDGEQHFKEKDNGFFRDSLEERQSKDEFKNQYCRQKGLVLKRIPYTDITQIKISDLLSDKYTVKLGLMEDKE